MGRAEMQKIIGTMTSQAPEEMETPKPAQNHHLQDAGDVDQEGKGQGLEQETPALAEMPAGIQGAFQQFALGQLAQPLARAGKTPGEAAPECHAQHHAGPAQHQQDHQGGRAQFPAAPEQGGVGNHHQRGEQEHGPQAEQPVHKNRDHRLRFLVVRFARGVEGLDHVPAGGTEEEGVEKLGDESNARGPAPRQMQALHFQHHPPAGHVEEDCQ